MTNIAGKWAGRVFGTNTGNIFLQLEQKEVAVTGTARFADSELGLTVFEVKGSSDEGVELELSPINIPEGAQIGKAIVKASLSIDGTLDGDWESDVGTAGVVKLYPHSTKVDKEIVDAKQDIPEQIFNKIVSVGSVRLYEDDVKDLILSIKEDFSTARPVVAFQSRGSETVKFADDFLADASNIDNLRSIKISIQEPESHGIYEFVVVELTEFSGSEIRVSGTNETWVLGKSQTLKNVLDKKRNRLVTNYREHGPNINLVIFLAMLVVIPEITDWFNRFIFVASITTLLFVLQLAHKRFIPNTLIILSQRKPTLWGRIWPSLTSWLIAATSSLVAMWIFYKLTQ